MLFFMKTETNVSWRGEESNAHDAVLTEEQSQQNYHQINFVHKTRRDTSKVEKSQWDSV